MSAKQGEPEQARLSAARCLTLAGMGLIVCILGLAAADSTLQLVFKPTFTTAVALVTAGIMFLWADEKKWIVLRARLSGLENLCRACMFLGLAGAINAALLPGLLGLVEAFVLLFMMRGVMNKSQDYHVAAWKIATVAGILFIVKFIMPLDISRKYLVIPTIERFLINEITPSVALCWALSIAGCGALINEWRKAARAAANALLEYNLSILAAERAWSPSLQEFLGVKREDIMGMELDELRAFFRERAESRVQSCIGNVAQLPRVAAEIPTIRGRISAPQIEDAWRKLKQLPDGGEQPTQ